MNVLDKLAGAGMGPQEDKAQVCKLIGDVYTRQDRPSYEKAAEAYEKAAELDSAMAPYALRQAAACYDERRNWQEAESVLEKLLSRPGLSELEETELQAWRQRMAEAKAMESAEHEQPMLDPASLPLLYCGRPLGVQVLEEDGTLLLSATSADECNVFIPLRWTEGSLGISCQLRLKRLDWGTEMRVGLAQDPTTLLRRSFSEEEFLRKLPLDDGLRIFEDLCARRLQAEASYDGPTSHPRALCRLWREPQ